MPADDEWHQLFGLQNKFCFIVIRDFHQAGWQYDQQQG
jgi:hypothetical protein